MAFKETCTAEWAEYRGMKRGVQKSIKKDDDYDHIDDYEDYRATWAEHYRNLKSWADKALSDLSNIEEWDCDLIYADADKEKLAQEIGENYKFFSYYNMKVILRIIAESATKAEEVYKDY